MIPRAVSSQTRVELRPRPRSVTRP